MAIRVRLIDIGETISVSPNIFKYNLVDEAKRIPPMAILCRIEKVSLVFFMHLIYTGSQIVGRFNTI